MEFMSVAAGIVAAIALPAFLALYFLKRRHEVVRVPSTKLWREAMSTLHADRPWQRLRTSLLFFLQLAAVLLLVFAAFRPVAGAGLPKEMIVVIDCSGSMQATDEMPSRFERARDEAGRVLAALPAGGRYTLIAAGATPELLVSRTADRLQARRALDGLKPQNGGAKMNEALELAAALRRETGAGLVVLSDRYTGDGALTVGTGGANRAVETLSASRVNGELQALTVVRSYGFAGAVTAECRADGKLVDAREVELTMDQTAVIYWTNLPRDTKTIYVRLTGKDALALDDGANCVVSAGQTKKVLLVSERNVFLEAALKLREDVELYKQAPADGAEMKGYDLYVFDGTLPDALPADGGVIAFNPKEGALEELKLEQGNGGVLSAAKNTMAENLLRNLDIGKVQLAKCSLFTLESGWQPLAWAGEKAVIAAREQSGRRMAALGFDLHDSNLPLLKEFPILMQNLMSWILSDVTGGVNEVKAGGSVPLLPHALANRIEVSTPSGGTELAAPPFPAVPFTETNELGIYRVKQYGADNREIGGAESSFAINAPTATESDLRTTEALPTLAGGDIAPVATASVNWWLLAAAAALTLVMAEWLVNRHVR